MDDDSVDDHQCEPLLGAGLFSEEFNRLEDGKTESGGEF